MDLMMTVTTAMMKTGLRRPAWREKKASTGPSASGKESTAMVICPTKSVTWNSTNIATMPQNRGHTVAGPTENLVYTLQNINFATTLCARAAMCPRKLINTKYLNV